MSDCKIGPAWPVRLWDGSSMAHHRWAWFKAHGPITRDTYIKRRCGNLLCINLEHLYALEREDLEISHELIKAVHAADRRGSGNSNSKLTEDQVIEMRQDYENGATGPEIAEKYGIHRSYAISIVNRKFWTHI